jgi:AcrR family transcriptional regulator
VDEAVSPELIAATESVLESHGWTGLTADQIAEAAGINRVTLYRRGLSTATLLTATATAAVVEFRSLAAEALLQPGTASQRLDQLLKALYELADRHLALLAGLFDGPTAMFHLSRTRGDASAITRFEYTEPFERLLRDGITDGTLRSTNPREDAELIFNTAGWVYVHLRRSHGWSARRARPAVTRVSAAFVRHPVASASASP